MVWKGYTHWEGAEAAGARDVCEGRELLKEATAMYTPVTYTEVYLYVLGAHAVPWHRTRAYGTPFTPPPCDWG